MEKINRMQVNGVTMRRKVGLIPHERKQHDGAVCQP
jgi:hypothetical protein